MTFIKFTPVLYALLLMGFVLTGCSVNPYNPEHKMAALKERTGDNPTKMHFLVFGDSKGSPEFKNVLKRADMLNPQFNITTADLVKKGGGESGAKDYQTLDEMGGICKNTNYLC